MKKTDEPLGDTISSEDAIRVMTLGGAHSMRKENELGSIEKGKAAEMVVLNRNLFEIDPDSIIDTNKIRVRSILLHSNCRLFRTAKHVASPFVFQRNGRPYLES
jgi:urease alpha subunit